MDSACLQAFIRRNRYAVISSLAPDGSPQSALVGVACSASLELVFDTLTTTRKYRNLTQRPQCSLVIGWTGEQTLQMEGVAHQPRRPELAVLQQVYFDQWPECRAHLDWTDIAYLVVRPTWMRYSDYSPNPPIILESRILDGHMHSL